MDTLMRRRSAASVGSRMTASSLAALAERADAIGGDAIRQLQEQELGLGVNSASATAVVVGLVETMALSLARISHQLRGINP